MNQVKHSSLRLNSMIWLLAALGLVSSIFAEDWPQWRGPNRDGAMSVSADALPDTWPKTLTQLWTQRVGTGYSTPILVGGRIYQYGRLNNDEVMTALDADSGEVLWRTRYAAPFKVMSAATSHGPGPKSTPTFADGRLFTLGMTGIVTAFDAETGRQIWQTEPSKVHPLYHTAMSPVVEGQRMIVHIGGHNDGALTAFDVATGAIEWRWDGDGPAYGSPMVFELAGTKQVVTFTQEHHVGVSLTTGELLWKRPYTTDHTTTSLTPILYKDMVIETGRGNGITAFRVTKNGNAYETADVWHTDEASLYMTNAVALDSFLFGLSHQKRGQYFGLDLETGDVLWTGAPRQAENAGIVGAGGAFFSLEEDGELLVVENSRTGLNVLARYDVANSETWAQPTLIGGDVLKIYIKDIDALTLWAFQ